MDRKEYKEIITRLAVLETKLDGFLGWQKRQNGDLATLGHSLDKFKWWLVGVLGIMVVNLVVILLYRYL